MAQIKKIFFDMDGVLADFVALAVKHLDDPNFFDKPETDAQGAAIDDMLAHHIPNSKFFSKLPTMPDFNKTRSIMAKLKKAGYEIHILTAVGKEHTAKSAKQKREWLVLNGLADYEFNYTKSSKEKAKYAAPDVLLIDDREKSIKPFAAAGGETILFKSANQLERDLKKRKIL